MIAFLGPAVVITALALLGWLADRLLSLRLAAAGAGCWPLRVFCGLSALYLLALHPAVLLAVIGGTVLAQWRSPSSSGHDTPAVRNERWLILMTVALLALVATRPLVPTAWDEFAWLGKARLETQGWGSLRRAELDPSWPLFGSAHPMLWPLAVARLATFHAGIRELVAAGEWLVVLVAVVFVASLHAVCAAGRRQSAISGELAGLGLLVLTPFVLVHLRLVYVDLSVGMMAGVVVLNLVAWVESAGTDTRWPLAGVAIPAIVLTGLKDEGAVWAIAIACAFAVTYPDRRSLRVMAATLVVPGLGLAMLWKLTTYASGVINPERVPTFHVAHRVVPLLVHGFLPNAGDLTTWGACWGVIGGTVLSTCLWPQRFAKGTRFAAGAFLALSLAAYTAMLVSPEGVFVQALSAGFILDRVLLQLVPVGAAVVSLVAADLIAAARPHRR